MERRRRSTTAGEMEWTPPATEPPHPASPGGSELSWEGDGGEEEEVEEDFESQMDERGIIGLEEAPGEELMLGLGEEVMLGLGEEVMLGLGEKLGSDEDEFDSPLYFKKGPVNMAHSQEGTPPILSVQMVVSLQTSQGAGQEWGLAEEEERGLGEEDEWAEEEEQRLGEEDEWAEEEERGFGEEDEWAEEEEQRLGEEDEWAEEEEQRFGGEDEWAEEEEEQHSGLWETGTPEPHEGPPMTVQELSFNLSLLLDSDPAEDDTDSPSQIEDQSLEGQDRAILQEGWAEDEDQHRVSTATKNQNQNRNWTPSESHRQLDTTEDELPESEWEDVQNSPAPRVGARGSRSTPGHSSLEYRTASKGLAGPGTASMKIELLQEQTGDHLTPTPSPKSQTGDHLTPTPSPKSQTGDHLTPTPSPRSQTGDHLTPTPSPKSQTGDHLTPTPSPKSQTGDHLTPTPSPRSQTGDHLTPTPSPRRNQLDVQRHHQPSPSGYKSELRLGHRNSSEFEPNLGSLLIAAKPHGESKYSLQESQETSDATFSNVELRESPSRLSPSHHLSPRNRPSKPDLYAAGETHGHYPEVFEVKGDAQKGAYKTSAAVALTWPPSPPPAPHPVPQISFSSHLPHPSLQDPTDFFDIQEEKFPEASCTESLPDSSVRHPRPTLSPQRHKHNSQDNPQSFALGPSKAEDRKSSPDGPNRRHRNPRTSKAERRSPSPAHRHTSPAANRIDVRRGKLSHPSPDFSKVQPRVHFPKQGYKPPKSRRTSQQQGAPPEPPMVFKSPAEIVREVLLSGGEDLQDTQEPGAPGGNPPQRTLNRTVPEDFRDPQQASTLMQQLQEDYKRLLTKYAAAENTIDRLRLEAKVGLYSDPPKPSHVIQSGSVNEGSKVMTLTFPQAQRAQLDTPQQILQMTNSDHTATSPARPSSVESVSSRQRALQAIEQLATALLAQVQRFHLQLDTFEELLRRGQLKAHDQMKGLCELAQGQEALERAYLAARQEHRGLQDTGSRLPPFDPNRDLEGQIFQSGMRLDELKEWVEQTQQAPPMSEPPPSLSPRQRDTLPHPQGPVSPVCVGDGMAIRVEVSSVSGASEGEEEEEEEELPSLLLRPLHQKHQRMERDFSNLLGHYQNVKELPQVLDVASRYNRHSTPDPDATLPPEDYGIESAKRWGSDSDQGQSGLSQQKPPTTLESPPGPLGQSQSSSVTDLPLGGAPLEGCSSHPGAQAVPSASALSGGKRSRTSSLYSLGDGAASASTALSRRGSKAQPRNARAPSQDGLLSPETDSGFVGSESSRLTPAVHSPLQQGETSRTSPPEEVEESGSPETVTDAGRPPPHRLRYGPPARGCTSPGRLGSARPGGGASASPERRGGGERRRRPPHSPSPSPSPQHWPREPLHAWTSSGDSDPHSLSGQEDTERSSQYYRQPANQRPAYQRGSALPASYHHGNHLKAQSSVQLTNQSEALQSLQMEVNRLKECLEDTLYLPLSSSAEPARPYSPPEHSAPHRPPKRSSRRDKGGAERSRVMEEEEEEEEVEDRGTQRGVLRPRRASVFSSAPDNDAEHAQSETKHSQRRIPAAPASRRGTRPEGSARRDGRGGRFGPTLKPRGAAADDSDADANQRRSVSAGCAGCASRLRANPATAHPGPERAASGRRPGQSGPECCPLCGSPEARRSAAVQTERQTDGDGSPAHRQPRPESSTRRGAGRVHLPPPPAVVLGSVPVVQCVPVYPSTLYYPGPPLKAVPMPFVSVGTECPSQAQAAGGRERGRSLGSSLDRALVAAAAMRSSSQHMVRTLSTSLRHQRALSQSCLY